jgi:hypothetical protein
LAAPRRGGAFAGSARVLATALLAATVLDATALGAPPSAAPACGACAAGDDFVRDVLGVFETDSLAPALGAPESLRAATAIGFLLGPERVVLVRGR